MTPNRMSMPKFTADSVFVVCCVDFLFLSTSAYNYIMSPFNKCARLSFSRKSALRTSSTKFKEFNNVSDAGKPSIIPRAAVSVVVRWSQISSDKSTVDRTGSPRYLLVQRGKEPNTGMWSLPGGKIEVGERTLDAAKRELFEETSLRTEGALNLKWHRSGPFACSDSIHHNEHAGVSFHYVISQCFAELQSRTLPNIVASDDAMDARWWSADEMKDGEDNGVVTKGVLAVSLRSEDLYAAGLLKCED